MLRIDAELRLRSGETSFPFPSNTLRLSTGAVSSMRHAVCQQHATFSSSASVAAAVASAAAAASTDGLPRRCLRATV
jgi:hypothetical protein